MPIAENSSVLVHYLRPPRAGADFRRPSPPKCRRRPKHAAAARPYKVPPLKLLLTQCRFRPVGRLSKVAETSLRAGDHLGRYMRTGNLNSCACRPGLAASPGCWLYLIGPSLAESAADGPKSSPRPKVVPCKEQHFSGHWSSTGRRHCSAIDEQPVPYTSIADVRVYGPWPSGMLASGRLVVISVDPEVHGAVNEVAMKRASALAMDSDPSPYRIGAIRDSRC
jgi:hypothetical protein